MWASPIINGEPKFRSSHPNQLLQSFLQNVQLRSKFTSSSTTVTWWRRCHCVLWTNPFSDSRSAPELLRCEPGSVASWRSWRRGTHPLCPSRARSAVSSLLGWSHVPSLWWNPSSMQRARVWRRTMPHLHTFEMKWKCKKNKIEWIRSSKVRLIEGLVSARSVCGWCTSERRDLVQFLILETLTPSFSPPVCCVAVWIAWPMCAIDYGVCLHRGPWSRPQAL